MPEQKLIKKKFILMEVECLILWSFQIILNLQKKKLFNLFENLIGLMAFIEKILVLKLLNNENYIRIFKRKKNNSTK